MVTFDFNNNCFKTVLPESFQSFPLYFKVTNIQTHKDPVFVEEKQEQLTSEPATSVEPEIIISGTTPQLQLESIPEGGSTADVLTTVAEKISLYA